MKTTAELFAGAGGLALGLKRAGFDTIWLAEIAEFPRRVLEARFPGTPLYGDVTTLDGAALVARHGPIDLLAGGSPCQDLSVAGKRVGLIGARSSLFHHQMRLWNETGAPLCLWENVAGALSSHRGKDFALVLSTIVGAAVAVPRDGWTGERCCGVVSGPTGVAAWRLLDAQYFGVPQRRLRIFVLGARAGAIDPAEVLLECQGVFGNPPTRGEARESTPQSPRGRADPSGRILSFDWQAGGDGDTSFRGKSRIYPVRKGEYTGALQAVKRDAVLEPPRVAYSLGSHAGAADGTVSNESHESGGPTSLGIAEERANALRAGRVGQVADCEEPVGYTVTNSSMEDAVHFNAYQRSLGEVASPLMADDHKKLEVGVITFRERGRGEDGYSCETRDDGITNTLMTPNGGRGGTGAADGIVQVEPVAGYGDATCPLRGGGNSHADDHNIVVEGLGAGALGPDDVADPISANEGKTYTHEGANNFRLHNVVAYPIQNSAFLRSGENDTPTADAEGRVRIRPPGMGVGEPGDPMFTVDASQPHAVLAFEPRYFTRDNKTGGEPSEVVSPLRAGTKLGDSTPHVLAFNTKQDGADAGELAPGLLAMPHDTSRANGGGQVGILAFDTVQITHPENRSRVEPGMPSPALNQSGQVHVCATGETTHALTATPGVTEDSTGRGTPIVVARMVAFGEYVEDGTASAIKGRDYKDATDLILEPAPPAAAAAFKPSHYTRGKDGAPSDVMPPLTADADKGDQDPLVFQGEAVALNNDSRGAASEVAAPLRAGERTDGGARGQQSVVVGVPRRLMPVECERLMGWDDGWTNVPDETGKPASDSQRYKAIGNGVVSHVAQWIGERILERVV